MFRKPLKYLLSYLCGIGFVTLMVALPATVLAAPKVSIDSPKAGATINSDHVTVKGTASAIGGGQGIDLIFVLDNSGSLGTTDPTKERFKAIQQLLNSLNSSANIHLGMVFFESTASVAVSLQSVSTAKSEINQAISSNTGPSGGTAIHTGIKAASDELTSKGRATASQIILVFTDGQSDKQAAINAATDAKSKGQVVHLVGLFPAQSSPFSFLGGSGNSQGIDNAKEIAKAGGGQFFIATQPSQLLALFSSGQIVNIKSVTIKNEATGKIVSATVIAGSFSSSVKLQPGQNKLIATAIDTDGNPASASITVTSGAQQDPCDINPSAPGCVGHSNSYQAKLRPQVLMGCFDPMLVDVVDDEYKVCAVVRKGMSPIQQVRFTENTGKLSVGMNFKCHLPNGDKFYCVTLAGDRGMLYQKKLANQFGSQVGEFNITVVDQAQQTHSFPNLEFGDNPNLKTTTPNTMPRCTQKGIRRFKPQVICGGIDPIMIDYADTAFKVKALVRAGGVAIKHVRSKNGGGFAVKMKEEGDIGNGDVMYTLLLTFPRGAFPPGSLRDLWGTKQDFEFVIEAVDGGGQTHKFPELQGGNFPAAQ